MNNIQSKKNKPKNKNNSSEKYREESENINDECIVAGRNAVRELLEITRQAESAAPKELQGAEREALMAQIEDQMLSAAQALDFETAAKLRDQLFSLKGEKTPGQKEQPKRRRRGR